MLRCWTKVQPAGFGLPRKINHSTLVLLLLGFALSACKATEPDIRQLAILYKSQQCPPLVADLVLLRSQQELDSYIGRAVGLGIDPEVPRFHSPEEMAVVISLGQKPTAGYSISLASTGAVVTDGELVLDVTHSEPREMAAQMLTSPCLVLKVNARGVKTIKRSDTGTVIKL